MRLLTAFVLIGAACGGPAAHPQEPATATPIPPAAASESAAPTPAPSASAPPADAPEHLPTKCADASAPVCTPPGSFTDQLCAKPHQDAALALFAKSTPFTRLYLRGKLDELLFDEEVLALRFRAPSKNGIQVGSANGTYDVLRWDGDCALGVEAEMITRNRPPQPKTARVKWHRISPSMQDALVASSDAVKAARAKRGKECKGAMTGDVSVACEKADRALVDAIVEYVRGGGALPDP